MSAGVGRHRERLFVLNEPHALRISPELTAEIGLNESIVLLQIEYLVSISGSDFERDGHRWTRASVAELRERYFPWWDTATISRTLKSLESRRLVLTGNYNRAGFDRTRWFTIDPEGVSQLRSVAISQYAKCISANCKMHSRDLQNAFAQDAETIEETYKETQEHTLTPSVASPSPKVSPFTWDGTVEEPPDPDRRPPTGTDPIAYALVEVLHMDAGELTRSGRESLRSAAAQLAEVSATPAEIRRRADAFRREYPRATLTAAALARHWSQLGRGLTTPEPVSPIAATRRPELDPYHPLNNPGGRYLDLTAEETDEVRSAVQGSDGGPQ